MTAEKISHGGFSIRAQLSINEVSTNIGPVRLGKRGIAKLRSVITYEITELTLVCQRFELASLFQGLSLLKHPIFTTNIELLRNPY
jgi:hypothetical protein